MGAIEELKKRIALMEKPSARTDDVPVVKSAYVFKAGDKVMYGTGTFGYVTRSDIDLTTIVPFSHRVKSKFELMDLKTYGLVDYPTASLRPGWDGDLEDQFAVGDKVHFDWALHKKSDQPAENGIVKALRPDPRSVYVVYKCDGDWDNYKEYTAESSYIKSLRHGWV